MVQSISLILGQNMTPSRNSDSKTKLFGIYERVGDMIFEFLEESEPSSVCLDHAKGDLEEDEYYGNGEEKRLFWQTQEQHLTENLFRTSSFEAKLRLATKAIVKEMKSAPVGGCDCGTFGADGCHGCLQTEISNRLQKAGYNCGICKAKWLNKKKIPAGEHSYIEVLETSNTKKGEIRVIIELNLRAEFEMVKACHEYNHLTSRLPEIYVGKTERLESLINLLCLALKKCMKDQKMHMAPWRKRKYMQAKWNGVRESEPISSWDILSMVDNSSRLSRPLVSMLTFDLVENMKLSSTLRSIAIKA